LLQIATAEEHHACIKYNVTLISCWMSSGGIKNVYSYENK